MDEATLEAADPVLELLDVPVAVGCVLARRLTGAIEAKQRLPGKSSENRGTFRLEPCPAPPRLGTVVTS